MWANCLVLLRRIPGQRLLLLLKLLPLPACCLPPPSHSLSLCNICNTQVKDADVQVNIQEQPGQKKQNYGKGRVGNRQLRTFFLDVLIFEAPNILFTGRCSRDPLSSHLVLNWKSLHGNPLWSLLINCWTISDAQVQLICEPADSSFQSLRQTLKIQFSNIFVVINWENLWVTNCRPGL